MSKKVTIDMGDMSGETARAGLFEKIGQLTMRMQEEDARIQRMAQNWLSSTTLDIDSSIRDAVLDYQSEPIIPEGYFEETLENQKKSLEVLESIRENTANLYTMVELINQNNEKQDELIALMTEILSLAKAKSKAEAEGLFKKIMGEICNTADSADSMMKIIGWATTVYKMVLPLLP